MKYLPTWAIILENSSMSDLSKQVGRIINGNDLSAIDEVGGDTLRLPPARRWIKSYRSVNSRKPTDPDNCPLVSRISSSSCCGPCPRRKTPRSCWRTHVPCLSRSADGVVWGWFFTYDQTRLRFPSVLMILGDWCNVRDTLINLLALAQDARYTRRSDSAPVFFRRRSSWRLCIFTFGETHRAQYLPSGRFDERRWVSKAVTMLST